MGEVYVKLRRGRWPFSKGLLVDSLLLAGVGAEAATSVAHTVEERLKAEGRREVTPRALRAVLLEEVEKALGPEVARRLARQTLAFEEILVREGRQYRPFSKGLLARSLEDAGFSLKEAHELAKEVEARLRREGVRRIGARRLEALVAEEVRRRHGRAAGRRYRERRLYAGELFVEEAEGEPRVPFSKGILAQSLMAVGLAPDRAYRIARELEARLHAEGRTVIRRDALRERVYRTLLEEAGEEVAKRYLVLRALRRSDRPVHVLIGGVTGVGKSVLATALAYRLGITHIISSDAVREVFRATLSAELLPTLHVSSFEAWSVLSREGGREELVIRGFLDQVEKVAVGLKAIQERAARERTSLVLEGVHVVPGYLDHPSRPSVLQVPMLVVVHDEKVHRDRFLIRDRETGRMRPKERYLDHLADIRLIQDHLERQAEREGVPVIPGENLDEAVEKALEVIVSTLEVRA
ncbi:ATP cone domain-containing protein [Thermus filiformis]|uniref:2-phosphoglycerate kinase n=1 Tax=Thermus filiformis TaxID=276 RepID=A0A0A2WRY3_THEFI|nr:ATP cone domain-containing protein [Thermus filiformis]KGQ21055.1 2-phosphoglycerate kinase [Thermus filiformis]